NPVALVDLDLPLGVGEERETATEKLLQVIRGARGRESRRTERDAEVDVEGLADLDRSADAKLTDAPLVLRALDRRVLGCAARDPVSGSQHERHQMAARFFQRCVFRHDQHSDPRIQNLPSDLFEARGGRCQMTTSRAKARPLRTQSLTPTPRYA